MQYLAADRVVEKKEISIWKLPKAKDELYAKWRDELLGEIKKTRDLDHTNYA